jgi:hypothetical protein
MDNNNNENPGNGAQPGNIPPAQQPDPSAQQQNPPAAAAPITIKKGNGFGIAALIVGIIAILGAWIPLLNFISLVFAIIALVLGAVGLLLGILKKRSKGLSIAGLALAVISIIVFAASYSVASSVLDAALDDEAVTEAIADAATDAIADAAAGAIQDAAEKEPEPAASKETYYEVMAWFGDYLVETTDYAHSLEGTDYDKEAWEQYVADQTDIVKAKIASIDPNSEGAGLEGMVESSFIGDDGLFAEWTYLLEGNPRYDAFTEGLKKGFIESFTKDAQEIIDFDNSNE